MIYRPPSDLTDQAVRQLLEINDIYQTKGLQSVTHGFVEQSYYFRFNVVVIDRKNVGFLWNSKGGTMSTRGIYFREAPGLAGEFTDWFLHSRNVMTNVRDMSASLATHRT